MNDRKEIRRFDEVRRRLRPGDVFHRADHDWKTQSDRRWKGGCPWHESSSGACFSVNPETLEWHCFHCERGGGPLEYVAELERIGGGARGNLKGQDFFRAWEALSRHAGCEGPPDLEDDDGRTKESDRRPLRKRDSTKSREKARASQKAKSAPKKPGGDGVISREIPPPRGASGKPAEPDLDTPERELREALVRYRETLAESEKARAYVEGRGLSVGTLRAYGCGFAPAGEWVGSDNAPRLVTPHTTAPGDGGRPKLVNLSGRYLGKCSKEKRHRHVTGNPTALFNASAIAEETGPLVFCEGPLDALSFIEAGHGRVVALHNTGGVPWTELRGQAERLVFAFDADDTGTEDAVERAREAVLRGYEAHVLPDGEGTYGGYSDPNEALQHSALNLSYLSDLAPPTESRETAANGRDPEADQSPTPEPTGEDGTGEGYTAADLVPYWNGDNIGHLGRWLWERGGVPDGDVGAGLYADRALHKWVAEKLQAGPGGTTEQDRIRLRWVLWRLYAEHGPEDVPDYLIPERPETERAKAATEPEMESGGRRRDPYEIGALPAGVQTRRTTAPKDNPHPGKRGIALDTPYSEPFIHELKTALPSWGRAWRGSEEVWVVDDCFAAFVGDLCRNHFG